MYAKGNSNKKKGGEEKKKKSVHRLMDRTEVF
jgi:hypothetical protein